MTRVYEGSMYVNPMVCTADLWRVVEIARRSDDPISGFISRGTGQTGASVTRCSDVDHLLDLWSEGRTPDLRDIDGSVMFAVLDDDEGLAKALARVGRVASGKTAYCIYNVREDNSGRPTLVWAA